MAVAFSSGTEGLFGKVRRNSIQRISTFVLENADLSGMAPYGGVRFELSSWSRLAKFPPTVAGKIGYRPRYRPRSARILPADRPPTAR